MRRYLWGVAVVLAGVAGFAIPSGASDPAANRIDRITEVGDSWTDIANDIAPTASASDKAAFARTLAQRNALDANALNDSLTADLSPGRLISYLPGDVPPPAAATTTTTGAPTSTTSTTIAATTTTAEATTTTAAATTTTAAATTTTTPATTTTVPSTGGAACGLASAAFCDTFDAPRTDGPANAVEMGKEWGVSQSGEQNNFQGMFNGISPTYQPCTGLSKPSWPYNSQSNPNPKPATVLAPQAAQICNGQFVDAYNDGGGVGGIMAYPKQPFSFVGRTGTVVFDLSADSDGTHGTWPEFVITDEPVPGVRREVSEQPRPHAKNEVGFSLDGGCANQPNSTGVGVVFGAVNDVVFQQQGSRPNCITKGSSTSMNHFEVRVSRTKIEVYGTDAGATTLKLLATENLNLAFEQGLIWTNHVNYNARKAIEPCECGTQYDHNFYWDNVGFDGPKTYRDVGFDVPFAMNDQGPSAAGAGEQAWVIGYGVGGDTPVRTFTLPGVAWSQTPTSAKLVFNALTYDNNVAVEARLNSGAWTAMTAAPGWPGPRTLGSFQPESRAITFPNLPVAGTNTVQVRLTNGGYGSVSNVSLILVAGAPVP